MIIEEDDEDNEGIGRGREKRRNMKHSIEHFIYVRLISHGPERK